MGVGDGLRSPGEDIKRCKTTGVRLCAGTGLVEATRSPSRVARGGYLNVYKARRKCDAASAILLGVDYYLSNYSGLLGAPPRGGSLS